MVFSSLGSRRWPISTVDSKLGIRTIWLGGDLDIPKAVNKRSTVHLKYNQPQCRINEGEGNTGVCPHVKPRSACDLPTMPDTFSELSSLGGKSEIHL